MTVEIKVPPLGESVSEATITWVKNEGDSVNADELIAELETEKVTLELNAPSAGVLVSRKFADGDDVTQDQVVALLEAGASGNNDNAPAEKKEEPKQEAAQQSAPKGDTAPYSPAAQKIAAETGNYPTTGSGKDGRVTKDDVANPKQTASAPVAVQDNQGGEQRVKMTKLRQKIAERLKESQNTAAILTTFNEVDMSAAMQLRKEFQDAFVEKNGIKLGFMSLFTKAAIYALKEIPAVNAEIDGNEIVYKNYYHIGIAVGTKQGLVVPVVRNAEQLSYADIEKTIAGYGKKAREGKLQMSDMTGGTFTISNGGVYGSLLSTPIINPPQTGILGLHKIQERPMAVNGEIKVRPMMYVALSYDHRLIDGAEAVTFLVKIKEAMEDPRRLLLNI